MKPAPRKSLVIVDDDQFYLSLLQQLLEEHLDCPIETFTRPREAVTALPGLNAGLIVTDYEMPELNGFEFMAEAANVAPGVPFVLITGLPITAAMERMVNTSALKSILHKPFNWRTLADEIARHWPESGAGLFKANAPSA